MPLPRPLKILRSAVTANRDYQSNEEYQRATVWRRTLLQGWIWMSMACFCAVIVTPNWYTIGPRSYMYPPEYKMLSFSYITTFLKTGATVQSDLSAYADAICSIDGNTDCDALPKNARAAILECRQLKMVEKHKPLMPCVREGKESYSLYHPLPYSAPVPAKSTVNFTYWEQDAKILIPRKVPLGGEMWKNELRDGHFAEFWTPCSFTSAQCQDQRHWHNDCPPGYEFQLYDDDACPENYCRLKCSAIAVKGTPLCSPPFCAPTNVTYIHAFTKVLHDEHSPDIKWCTATNNHCEAYQEFTSMGESAHVGFITVVALLAFAGYFITFSRRRKYYVFFCLLFSFLASCTAAAVLHKYTSAVESLMSHISVPQDDVNRFYFHPISNVNICNMTEWNWRRLTAQMHLAHRSAQYPDGFRRMFAYYFTVIFVVVSFATTMICLDFCIFLYCGTSPCVALLTKIWASVLCIPFTIKYVLDMGITSLDVSQKQPTDKIYALISSGQRYSGCVLDWFWDYVVLFPVHAIRALWGTPTAADMVADTEKDALRRVGVHFDRCHTYLASRRSYLVLLCFLGIICMPFRVLTMLSSIRSLYSAEYDAYFPGNFESFACNIKEGRCLSDRTPVKDNSLGNLRHTRVQRSFVFNHYTKFVGDKRAKYKVHVRPNWLDSCGEKGGVITVSKAVAEDKWDKRQDGVLKVQVQWDHLTLDTLDPTKKVLSRTFHYDDNSIKCVDSGEVVRFDTAKIGKRVQRGPKWAFSQLSDWCGGIGHITHFSQRDVTVEWELPHDVNVPNATDWMEIRAWYAQNTWYVIETEKYQSELLREQSTRAFDFLHYFRLIGSTIFSELKRQAISVDSLKLGVISVIQMIGLLFVAHSLRQWTHFGKATQFLLTGWACWTFAPVVTSLIPARSFVDLTETAALLNTFLVESRDELSTDRWLALCDYLDSGFLSISVTRATAVCRDIEDWAKRTKEASWKKPKSWLPYLLTKWTHMSHMVQEAASVCANLTDAPKLTGLHTDLTIPLPNINDTATKLMTVCSDLGNSFGGRSLDAVVGIKVGNINVGDQVVPGHFWNEGKYGHLINHWGGTITSIDNATSACSVCWELQEVDDSVASAKKEVCKEGRNATYTCAPGVTPLGQADAKSNMGRSVFMHIEWAKTAFAAHEPDIPEVIRMFIGLRAAVYNFATLCMTAAFFTTPLMKAALRMKTIFPQTTVLSIFLTLAFVGSPLVWAAAQFFPQIVGSDYLLIAFLIYSFSPLLYFFFGKYYMVSQPMDDQQSVNVIFRVKYYLSFTNSLIPFTLIMLWICFGNYVYLPWIRSFLTTIPPVELVVYFVSYLLISYLLSMQAGFDWYAGEFITQHKYQHAPLVIANTVDIREAANAQKLCGTDIDLQAIDNSTYVCGGHADRSRLFQEDLAKIETWAEKTRTYQVSLSNKYNDTMDALTAALEDHGEYPRVKMEERRRKLIQVLRRARAQKKHDLLHTETVAPKAFKGNSTAVETTEYVESEMSASSSQGNLDSGNVGHEHFAEPTEGIYQYGTTPGQAPEYYDCRSWNQGAAYASSDQRHTPPPRHHQVPPPHVLYRPPPQYGNEPPHSPSPASHTNYPPGYDHPHATYYPDPRRYAPNPQQYAPGPRGYPPDPRMHPMDPRNHGV